MSNDQPSVEGKQTMPVVQPEQHRRAFKGIVVEYPSYCAYPEYKGKPYFSIKYTENGQEFIGYGTYKPEVLSEFLKEYFMPSVQPDNEDLIEAIKNGITVSNGDGVYFVGFRNGMRWVLSLIDSKEPTYEPSAEGKRGVAEWIWKPASNGWADHVCSNCGFTENTDIHVSLGWRYCPQCGFYMKGNRKKKK